MHALMTSSRSRARIARTKAVSAANRPNFLGRVAARPYSAGATAAIATLAIAAFVNHRLARSAERNNPARGKFVEVDGIRLHYVEQGKGEPLVVLHGNGSMIQDFASSGLIDLASKRYRVIAFDRPGFGHSERPRSTIWTAEEQGQLIGAALGKLGVSRATLLAHSWGCSVAVALALRSPDLVRGLVLASGYYYPSIRADVVTMSGPAIPVLGDAIRFTLSPILARLMWPLLRRKIFGPAPVPQKFEDGFPKEMTFRPSQIRASAAESALMIPGAFALRERYSEMKMPIVIVAGEGDRLIDIDDQSARLHAELPHSIIHRVPGAGHMVHQTSPDAVMAAINEAASWESGGGKVLPLAA
jgi:pimeloyl-ACP methyl ester carboxylesterase